MNKSNTQTACRMHTTFFREKFFEIFTKELVVLIGEALQTSSWNDDGYLRIYDNTFLYDRSIYFSCHSRPMLLVDWLSARHNFQPDITWLALFNIALLMLSLHNFIHISSLHIRRYTLNIHFSVLFSYRYSHLVMTLMQRLTKLTVLWTRWVCLM